METENASQEEISKFMVGRDVILKMDKKPAEFGETLLEIKNLSYENQHQKKMLNNVNLQLKRGQILGVAGVEGNGQNELAECIFGFYKNVGGEILFKGKNLLENSIMEIRNSGVSYIPEDRIWMGWNIDCYCCQT